jgi:4-carboxymuconolactone decarboxylase
MNPDTLPTRILEIEPDEMSTAQKSGVEALLAGRGRLLAPYKIWLHSPDLMMAMEQLGTFLNKRSSLTERQVELGICLAAHHWAGDYVFESHAARCVGLGFPATVIEAIRNDSAPDLPDSSERAVYDIARLARQPGPGPDAAFDGAVMALGRDGLAEVICLLGYYSAVAIGMKLHRMPPKQRT